jgi:hypothetical protein
MRKSLITVLAITALLCVGSCTNGSKGTKFAAEEKESTMSDAERAAAIAAKRASLAGVDTTVLTGNGIKLTILTPEADAENYVTEKMSSDLAIKLLSIASKNGISGMGGDPAFVLAAGITGVEKKLTGTAPQKTMLTYDLTIYVGNAITGTVFGSTTVKLIGVGDNEQRAANNAVSDLKDNKEIQQMLSSSTNKIIEYYNTHSGEIKSEVESYIAKGDYSAAYGLLYSVPEQATELFAYAAQKLPDVSAKILAKESTQSLANLKSAIASNPGHFTPEAGAYLAMIPSNAPEYAEAQQIYAEYTAKIQETQAEENAQKLQEQAIARDFEMKKMELAAKSSQKMSSKEMRRRIASEDAHSSPFKMLLFKLCYGLSDKIHTKDDSVD